MFSYDRFGNRAVLTSSTTPTMIGPNPVISATNNRITPRSGEYYYYDGAGNMTRAQSGDTLDYDAENKLVQYQGGATQSGGANYFYDGDGRRVKKARPSETLIFVYNISGQLVAEYTTSSPEQNGTSYLTSDTLGTPRVITKADGSVRARHDYLPFGEELYASAGSRTTGQKYDDGASPLDNTRQKFTQKERDTETGLDYFQARYYSSVHGRFASTDPVVVTPGRFVDPQQFNLYAFVRNNPLRFVDPTGKSLTLSGSVNEARNQLCQQIGGDCDRISFDAKTNTFTVDLNGIDLLKNEGAKLIDEVVRSKNHYDLAIGSTVQTMGGVVKVGAFSTNLDNKPDDRLMFKKGKTDKDKPKKGVDAQIGIDVWRLRSDRTSDTDLNPALPYTVVFHELAEAYAKLEHNKQYDDAHKEAEDREKTLRDQRPYLKRYNPGSGPGDRIYIKQ